MKAIDYSKLFDAFPHPDDDWPGCGKGHTKQKFGCYECRKISDARGRVFTKTEKGRNSLTDKRLHYKWRWGKNFTTNSGTRVKLKRFLSRADVVNGFYLEVRVDGDRFHGEVRHVDNHLLDVGYGGRYRSRGDAQYACELTLERMAAEILNNLDWDIR